MNKNIKYLSDREKARLQLLEDEIYMLNNKVQRTIKKRDLLQKEVKRITELEDEIYMLNNKVQRTIKKRDLLQKEVKRITELLTKTTQNE